MLQLSNKKYSFVVISVSSESEFQKYLFSLDIYGEPLQEATNIIQLIYKKNTLR